MHLIQIVMLVCVTLLATACGSGSDSADSVNSSSSQSSASSSSIAAAISKGIDPERFLDGALAEDISTVDCTLSDGTASTCYQVTINGAPSNADIGPFCPPSITSDASEGGIWFDGSGEVYELDGAFIMNLDTLYGSEWMLYDSVTGLINITDTQLACESAARPNVDPAYQNYCVECKLEYTGGPVQQTFLIPTQPVALNSPERLGFDIGLGLNGVVFAGPAPVDAILSNYTIAAFDDCGGHINPAEGYHYHAAIGCAQSEPESDGHAAMIGVALDGYGIYAMTDDLGLEPEGLDECRGHSDTERGYHYHAASPGENMFIGCYHGAQGDIVETRL
ncbi:YHYH protein [Gilvimarinus sp. 1_MG-2023]|uniref:YHYH protein n=1 Tax=Gilvimarinus sp. 1_MG-2023 TaxID=3062638 RepID=UPI0026E20239|nr:YHYH protein [Gilvimarinus sp. 1_MG-2023]MDO6748441.1 YHYH protein [Gilvimarinus sp. 1_MG-2023]